MNNEIRISILSASKLPRVERIKLRIAKTLGDRPRTWRYGNPFIHEVLPTKERGD